MKCSGLGRSWKVLGRALVGSALAVCLCCKSAFDLSAQTVSDTTPGVVARLSLLEGEAHVSASGSQAEVLDAALNMPLAAGEVVRTGANADTEVEFADGSVLRSAANSAATLIRLQPQTEIGLDDGLYYLELRAAGDTPFVVYAGDLNIEPKDNASFRVRVRNAQPEIAVLRGAVSVTRANSYTVDVQQGESLRSDAKDSRRYLLADTIGTESADSWNERRAQQTADSSATQTIARQAYAGGQGYGWSDLDSNGNWYPLPGEGLVWQPYGVDASFDPYAYGSWVYGGVAGGGGYVWASGYPWGWLPYHCGAWSFFPGFGWGWQPAAGCRSFGAGWPIGSFSVKHPPHGWHGPLPSRPPANGGIVTRHPTLPVASVSGAAHLAYGGTHPAQPIQVNGVTLRPLAPVAPAPTPHGSSAVGSALRRDYPVQEGTHVPLIGLETEGAAATPGRAPEWHAPASMQSKGERTAESLPANGLTAERSSEEAVAEARSEGRIATDAPHATGEAPTGETLLGGWHSRIPSTSAVGLAPAGAGSVKGTTLGIRPMPGSTGHLPVASPVTGAPVVVAPVRPVSVAPVPPRPVSVAPAPPRAIAPAPPPTPAPHFSMPSAPAPSGSRPK